MKYVSNAFSLQMLLSQKRATVTVRELSEAPDLSGAQSFIGHQEIASILGVPMNRASLKLQAGDVLYVAQYVGGRLSPNESPTQENIKESLKFFEVTVTYH